MRSLVGHYLEHSRVFRFGRRGEGEVFIGSSDLMPRNLDRRVEAVVPIVDPTLREQIEHFLELELADDTLAWELAGDGRWKKVAVRDGVDSQRLMQSAAMQLLVTDGGLA